MYRMACCSNNELPAYLHLAALGSVLKSQHEHEVDIMTSTSTTTVSLIQASGA